MKVKRYTVEELGHLCTEQDEKLSDFAKTYTDYLAQYHDENEFYVVCHGLAADFYLCCHAMLADFIPDSPMEVFVQDFVPQLRGLPELERFYLTQLFADSFELHLLHYGLTAREAKQDESE